MDKREKIEKKKERLETKIKDCDDQIAEIEKAKALKAKIEKMKQEERLEKAEQKKLKQLQREYAREQDKIRKKNEQIAQKNKVVEKREAEKETKVKKDFNKREKYLKYGVDPNIKTLPKKKKVNVFKMLDYNQLQMEVNKYGYHYSFKKILMHYLIAVILAVAVGMVFKLKFYLIGVIVLAAIIFTPSIILTFLLQK